MDWHPLFSNIYLNPANAFIGINASGKSSVLKVILLALDIINNKSLNHAEARSILVHSKLIIWHIRLSDCPYTASASIVNARIDSFGFIVYEQSSCVNVPVI